MDTTLQEQDRMKLDGIVQKMISNKESDSNINLVVSDFKQKYAKSNIPETPPEPNYIQRVGQDYNKAGQDIVSGIQQGATDINNGNAFGGIRAGLRTVGGIAGAAFAPISEAPIIKPILDFIGKKITSVPVVHNVIDKANELATKYPQASKDIGSIVNILSLGAGGAAEGPILKEGKLITQDAINASKIALTPSEQSIQSKITSLFQKSIKPTAKKTLAKGTEYQNDTLNALKTIKSNADSLNILDASGELVNSRTPQTINELAQAVDQTKKTVFTQYDNLAKTANKVGATIDTAPIADEVLKISQNKALQITNPEVVKYAQDWATRLRGLNTLDTETTQSIVQNLNQNLQAFYRNPTYESASKVAVDAGIANNFRQSLDKAIEGATGEQYQILKNQYKSLKAIENDVVRAAARDARKNIKGLLDYTDMFTGGQMLAGITSLNPAMFTKGAVERGFKEYIKFVNDPNRAIDNIFKQLDKSPKSEFIPKSATANFIKNPKLGLSIDNVAKNITSGEKGTIRDFTDYVNGSYKPTGSTLVNLKRDAQEIADKYGFKASTKGDKALSNQFGEYLDSVGFDKKLKK